ncbi:hypothetical protein RND81_14G088400 [Saponaria officinalis]|uniref:BRCT domain-containing protein n=1 Tax=Saponaria officinalis TaxID=3572 RepID=A0AAW1GRU5_SAPOF
MAILPFRSPHFSDNADSIRGNDPAKDSNLLLNGESRYKSHNIRHLYLSGEDSSPISLTREKVLHFNLHLSTDGAPLHSVELQKRKITMTSNMDNNTSDVNLCLPDENCSGYVCVKTLCKTKNSAPDNIEIYNAKGTECNDINDAVELSVAASEALVIHDIIQSESIAEPMSAAAILEVALRVKRARLDELQDSVCCFKDPDNTSDTLSDLNDSDLDDVYNDVGLPSSLASSMDPSVSRVEDTPMTHVHTEGEREVQSEWNQDEETLENNPDTDTANELPNGSFDIEKHEKASRTAMFDSIPQIAGHQGNGTFDNTQMNQDIDVCVGKESNGAKTICKMLIKETSYLSESTYVPSDQNSVVKCRQSCSNSSNANKFLEDSYKTSTRETLLSQDFVKDSNSSCIDPLCSMVPCSISSEISKSPIATKKYDNLKVIDFVPSLKIGTKVPLETVQTSSDQNDENIGSKDHPELIPGDVCINPIILRQTKSLKEYSCGLLGNSPPSLEKSFNFGLEEEEGNEVLLDDVEKVTYNNSTNAKDLMKALHVESIHGCASAKMNEGNEDMRLLAMDQHISCSNTSNTDVPNKKQFARSTASCTIPTNREESHFGNSAGRHFKDHCKGSDKNQAQMQIHVQDMPKSPLVFCQRTRRFRAPMFPVTDLLSGTQEQVCGSPNICHKRKGVPQGELHGPSNTETSAQKRVRFSDADIKPCSNKSLKRNHTLKRGSKIINTHEPINEELGITSQEVKECLTNCRLKGRKKPIFQGLDFLLTGFSKKKEQEIEGLLRKHGGMVLSDIPTPISRIRERRSSRSYAERLPVVICSRKLQTTTFLYGCAMNAFLLKAGWAYGSVKAGSVLPPDKYQVLSNRTRTMLNQIGKPIGKNDINYSYIFVRVGIMLHGTHSFCTKLAQVIKHGQGLDRLVYSSLQSLVQSLDKKKISLGAIVVEDDNQSTRHLKKYASEQKIPVMPAAWIVNSLLEGKLFPAQDNFHSRQSPPTEAPKMSVLQDRSQEI